MHNGQLYIHPACFLVRVWQLCQRRRSVRKEQPSSDGSYDLFSSHDHRDVHEREGGHAARTICTCSRSRFAALLVKLRKEREVS